jgi:acetyl-CoA carboxylase biotin carboxylase subunit
MDRALGEFEIVGPGVCTTVGFLRRVLAFPLFRDGKHNVSVVEDLKTFQGP